MTGKQYKFDRDSTIVLADPIQDWSIWKTCAQSLIEPLGLEIIGAVLQSAGYKVKILQAQGQKIDEFAKKIFSYHPQIVGITSYTYNSEDAIELTKKLKSLDENITAIYGGYHASFVPEVLKDGYIDLVVHGPGEDVILEIIKSLETGEGLQRIASISYRNNKGQIHTNKNKNKKNKIAIDNIPFAIREKDILKNCRIDSLTFPPPSQQKNVAAIYAARGCPYSCLYCTAPSFYNQKVYFRNPQRVADELETLHKEYDTNMVYFTDLTFNLNNKYVEALCDAIIKKRIELFWYALFRPGNISKELAVMLRKAGCSKVSLGIESFDLKTLSSINRYDNKYIEKIKNTLIQLDEAGIITRGLVMVGNPWESQASYENLINNLFLVAVDDIRVGIITPFPGTGIYRQYKDNKMIVDKNYEHYDGRHVVHKTENISKTEIPQAIEKIYRKYYNSEIYNDKTGNKIVKNPNLKESFCEFEIFLKERGIK